MSGVLAAVLSTALGGTAIVATRFLAGAADRITIGVLRFGGGAVLLLPLALIKGEQWPATRDWPAVIGLALIFFAVFPVLFNAALILHDGSSRWARAFDHASHDDAGRRHAPDRAPDRPQEHRARARHGWRGDCL